MKNNIKSAFFIALSQLIFAQSLAILPEGMTLSDGLGTQLDVHGVVTQNPLFFYHYHRTISTWKSIHSWEPYQEQYEKDIDRMDCDSISFIGELPVLVVGCRIDYGEVTDHTSDGHFFQFDAETGNTICQKNYPGQPVQWLSLPRDGSVGSWLDENEDEDENHVDSIHITDFSEFIEIRSLSMSFESDSPSKCSPNRAFYSLDGNVIGSVSVPGDSAVWDLDTSRPFRRLFHEQMDASPFLSISFFGFSPDSKSALSHVKKQNPWASGFLIKSDVATGLELAKASLKLSDNGFAMWTPDGKWIVLRNDQQISIWDPNSLEMAGSQDEIPLSSFPAAHGPSMAISRDSSLLAVTLQKGQIGLYALPSLERRQILNAPYQFYKPEVHTISFSADSLFLAASFHFTVYFFTDFDLEGNVMTVAEKDNVGVYIWKLTNGNHQPLSAATEEVRVEEGEAALGKAAGDLTPGSNIISSAVSFLQAVGSWVTNAISGIFGKQQQTRLHPTCLTTLSACHITAMSGI